MFMFNNLSLRTLQQIILKKLNVKHGFLLQKFRKKFQIFLDPATKLNKKWVNLFTNWITDKNRAKVKV